MESKILKVNRAPVMTLWAVVVAERLGYDPDEALSLGRGVAGLNAQSKGQRLGIFEPSKEGEEGEAGERGQKRAQEADTFVELLGRPVPARKTDKGLRALSQGRPLDAHGVQRYLENKFGDALKDVRQAMEDVAGSYEPQELERKAYDLYEKFRPEIPEGKRGWGAQGNLDYGKIRSLRK